MARTFDFYIARATTAMNNGFTSKSAQKDAMADVTSAYELACREIRNACLAARTEGEIDGHPALLMTDTVEALYWGLPAYPHLFKPKHAAMIRTTLPDLGAAIEQLVQCADLREVIKAQPIVAPVRNETVERSARISKSILDLMALRGEQYNRALDLGSVFSDEFGLHVRMPITANVHSVTNEHGTTFLRAFYYLNGAFTPLSVIMAAAGELVRQG